MALSLPAPLSELDKDYAERRARVLAKRKEKKLARSLGLTIADMEYAIKKFDGSLAHAAEFLGCTRRQLKIRVDDLPVLTKLMHDIREEKKDIAEFKLHQQVQDGYFPAISLTLKTLAKDRGYTERATLEHELGENAAGTAAALIEAMRKAATPVLTDSEPETVEVKEYEWLDSRI